MRNIKVCAGIGDNIWLLQKLINTGETFDFQLPDGIPQRGKQIFDLLPQVANSATYVPGLSYATLAAKNIQAECRYWHQIKEQDFYLSCNWWLEHGHRLENFFPDIQTSFRIPWQTEKYSLNVERNFPSRNGYIGIYGSSYSTTRAWGFWDEHKWFDLIARIYHHNPTYVYVIIGAEWDLDLGRKLVQLLQENRIPYINTIGEPLGAVIEIMKRLHYLFSFPSGMGILAPTVGCAGVMFYPDHLKAMVNAWAAPEDIASGLYKGCMFCEPAEIFEWATTNQKV